MSQLAHSTYHEKLSIANNRTQNHQRWNTQRSRMSKGRQTTVLFMKMHYNDLQILGLTKTHVVQEDITTITAQTLNQTKKV